MQELSTVDSIHKAGHEPNLWQSMWRHWLPAVSVAAIVFVFNAYRTLTEIPAYQSEILILLSNKTYVPVVPSEGQNQTSNDIQSDLSTDIEVLRSPTLVASALKRLPSPYQDLSVSNILPGLSLRQASIDANILVVSYTDTDPKRAQAVLEAIGPTYVQYSLESRKSPVTNAIQFIETRLPEARLELNQSSAALTAFRKRYAIDNPDTFVQAISENSQNLQEQADSTKTALLQSQRQVQELQRQLANAGRDPNTVLADSVLSQDATYIAQVNQLRELEAQYSLESTRLNPNHPVLLDLEARRDEMRQLVQKQIQRVQGTRGSPVGARTLVSGTMQQGLADQLLRAQIQLATQTAQLNGIRQAQAEVAQEFKRVTAIQQNYQDLQRQYRLNSQVVDTYLTKLEELGIVAAQEASPWKILEPPFLPNVPVSPNKKQGLLMGLLASIACGGSIAYLLAKLDKRITGVEELQQLSGLPLLASIPKINQPDPISIYGDQLHRSLAFNAFVESVRSLALMSLHQHSFKDSDAPGKSFAFTSSIAEEGKTTLAFNLGLALAELGNRVLIVDADLRSPSVHHMLRLPNIKGLSTALSTNIPWQELVQNFDPKLLTPTLALDDSISLNGGMSGEELFDDLYASIQTVRSLTIEDQNTQELDSVEKAYYHPSVPRELHILTAGPAPSNPTAWLASEKMFQLIEDWSQAYDSVLIDCAPLIGLADTHGILPQVKEVILVVDVKHLNRSHLKNTMEIFQGTRCIVSGFVANFVGHVNAGYYPNKYYSVTSENSDLGSWNSKILCQLKKASDYFLRRN